MIFMLAVSAYQAGDAFWSVIIVSSSVALALIGTMILHVIFVSARAVRPEIT
jgi:hypothetical protein